jgi:hypothetical protein
MNWRLLFVLPWLIFGVYWIAGALKTRTTVSQESSGSRFVILLLEILGFVLLFVKDTGIELLDRHIFPQSDSFAATGLACTWIGIGIAVWGALRLVPSPYLFRARPGCARRSLGHGRGAFSYWAPADCARLLD